MLAAVPEHESRMIDLSALILMSAFAATPTAAEHRAEIEQWRRERVERLTAPTGWLSLVGLHWLRPGASTIGNGEGVDIDLGRGPAQLGMLSWEADRFHFKTSEAGIRIGGMEALGAELKPDSSGSPTLVEFGGVQFYVLQRGERFGLRVKDADAPTRTGFSGIDYFDIDPQWRFEARWEAHDPVREIPIATVHGVEEMRVNPGRAVFEHDGERWSLEALTEDGTEDMFFIVFDGTSGKETYGSGRFMYAKPAQDGRIVIDFNKLYNPPCAFTEYSTCPLPPPENRIRLPITAGERKYGG
jgi:uncharacterized protein (DUF1684 family)